ncbi:uncharacterized protein BP5553_06250 [Venustampulla echinocandica]|uniref:Uncharacterized protein n=1 Tax=Venustampulla echinocandica TaxID=2656787 RepID=A0A370TN15_9HELO|nr:uncharacterized protein BP5553_06250 [Venustampulla echinocandica]RDL36898.1 hypothetical protein BP5553_06250 [Venustampulla echinocandica]
MAARPRTAQPVAVNSESEDEAHEVNNSVMKTAENIVIMSKKRREARRLTIDGEHQQSCKELKAKIENIYAARKNKTTMSRQMLLERLETLNNRRENLEKLILTSVSHIELQTKNISSEIVAMLQGRLEELEELPSGATVTV